MKKLKLACANERFLSKNIKGCKKDILGRVDLISNISYIFQCYKGLSKQWLQKCKWPVFKTQKVDIDPVYKRVKKADICRFNQKGICKSG